jgi:opacity protein-like surface antigen
MYEAFGIGWSLGGRRCWPNARLRSTASLSGPAATFVFGAEADFSPSQRREPEVFRLGYAADRVLFLWHRWRRPRRRIQRTTKGGWTAGAGVEAAFGENLTARIEYLYLRLQSGSCTIAATCGVDIGGAPRNDTVKFSTSVIRLGVDYKFH